MLRISIFLLLICLSQRPTVNNNDGNDRGESVDALKEKVDALEAQLAILKRQLADRISPLSSDRNTEITVHITNLTGHTIPLKVPADTTLDKFKRKYEEHTGTSRHCITFMKSDGSGVYDQDDRTLHALGIGDGTHLTVIVDDNDRRVAFTMTHIGTDSIEEMFGSIVHRICARDSEVDYGMVTFKKFEAKVLEEEAGRTGNLTTFSQEVQDAIECRLGSWMGNPDAVVLTIIDNSTVNEDSDEDDDYIHEHCIENDLDENHGGSLMCMNLHLL